MRKRRPDPADIFPLFGKAKPKRGNFMSKKAQRLLIVYALAALCAGMAFSGAACGAGFRIPGGETAGAPAPSVATASPADDPEMLIEMGEVAMPFDDGTGETGAEAENPPASDCTTPAENTPVPADQFELSGMVPYDE